MRILTFTSLYPNTAQPTLGIFIHQRMKHVALLPETETVVVAPVTYVPRWITSANWRRLSEVSKRERNSMDTYHPRYLLLPKVSMPFHGLLMFLGSYWLVKRLHKERPFDCIDAHYVYPDGFAAMLIGQLLNVPVIVSARGTDINLFPSFRLIRPMIRWTLRKANGLIAVCSALKEAMIGLGSSPAKVEVIGNGVDLERFWPIERKEACRKLNISPNQVNIVSVGGLIRRKGFQFLIPAFEKVARLDPRLALYIVGEGPSRTELDALIKSLGIISRVHLVGNQPNDELRYWFSACLFSCLVSSREGWPNVLLESLACGTPVVATGVWGTPEVIVSPDVGVIVEQSVPSIADGLRRALARSWDRRAIRSYAERRTWDDVAKEVRSFLSHTAATTHPARNYASSPADRVC